MSVVAPRRSARSEDDRALARRAGRGDQAAFTELYERHAPGLLSFVQQYVGDRAAAEDVVQQTFLAAFRTLSGGTTVEHPRAWLYHVARNNALTMVRDRRPAALERALEDDLLDRAAAVPAQIEQREALEEVVRDIVALPAQQRAALAMFEIADLSQAEIAQALDCTPAQVKALVYQARSSLAGRRDARSATCTSVRERLTTARGGSLNQRGIRLHLRQCEPCTAFRNDLRDRRRRVALLLPVLPAPGLRDAVLGAVGADGHSAAGAAAGMRPGHARWIAGGTTATAAVLGVAWLAWPGAQHPEVQTRAPAAVAAPETRVTAPAASSTTPTARASRSSRSARRRPHAATTAAARPAKAGPREAKAPAATPLTTAPARPRPPARTPGTHAPPAPRAESPPRAQPPPRPAAPAPSPPSATTPSPAATPTPVTPAPAGPVAAAPEPAPPASAPPCTDHSHASEQGLEHGKGHHKC